MFNNILKFTLTRAVFFYLICFLMIWRILDYPQLMSNAVPQTMSRLTPPMDYFDEFVDRQDHYDQFKLINCVNYHKAVVQFFEYQKAEAYGMLGFCYERLGQISQAVASYQNAITSNPDYMWPYYDLGVINYRQGKYTQASNYFRQAIEQNPLKTLFLLTRSKVYNDVRLSDQDGSYDYLQGIKQGQLSSYILLMDSLLKANDTDQLMLVALNGIQQGLEPQSVFYYYGSMAAHRAGKEEIALGMMHKAVLLRKGNSQEFEQYLKPSVRFF
jgi:tetratricopeptide (TPR) repeat protein